MGRALLMVRKDLLRQLRSPLAVLLLLAFPLIFSALLALSFGSSNQPRMPVVQLLVEDRDQTLLSGLLLRAFSSGPLEQMYEVRSVGPEGSELMERGEASALLRIPERFSSNLLNGKPITLELVRNPAQAILPEIAEQTLTVLVDVLATGSRVLREPLDQLSPMLQSGGPPTAEQVAVLSTTLYGAVSRAEPLLLPPVMTLEEIQLTEDEPQPASSGGSLVFLFVLPGISVWALFVLGDVAMRDILVESRDGTLRRQLCAPISAGQIVTGKALYSAVLATISLIILSIIGRIVSGGGVDLAAFVLLSAALVVMVTGFSSVVYGLSRTERQGASIAAVALLVLAFLGGSFVPLNSMPGSVRPLAPISPLYWGTQGYTELIQTGAGIAAILPNVAVLAVAGAITLSAGGWLLGRKVRGGLA